MNAIGTAVTGGMVSATLIDLIFIPLFFVLISRLFGVKSSRRLLLPLQPRVKSESEETVLVL
jgi:hypothetical protein